MIDACKGFIKDGNKNRLREQDIHKIVDVFTNQREIPSYSRMVSFDEIDEERIQSQPSALHRQPRARGHAGHRRAPPGGIPAGDVDALGRYWEVCPTSVTPCSRSGGPGYLELTVDKNAIKSAIYSHPEFTAFISDMNAHFTDGRTGANAEGTRAKAAATRKK